jgi:hypothetical protein
MWYKLAIGSYLMKAGLAFIQGQETVIIDIQAVTTNEKAACIL